MDNSKHIPRLKYLIPCLVLLVSIGYQVLYVTTPKSKIVSTEKFIRMWDKLISEEPKKHQFSRIAVGINGDVDLILQGTELLKSLVSNPNSTDVLKQDHHELSNFDDLNEIFTLFFSNGAGGERYFNNDEMFQHIVEKCMETASKYIGGNAALIAQKMLELRPNADVTVGLPVGPILNSLLDPKLNLIDSESTLLVKDEYHIVLEFSKDEIWNGHTAPASSRFIFSHDVSNSNMNCMNDFIQTVKTNHPQLVVISGIHMLESINWNSRLDEISENFKSIPSSSVVHLELASMASVEFVKSVIEKVLPYTDSIGLNEQELWLLCRGMNLQYCNSNTLQPDIPVDVKLVTNIIGDLFKHMNDGKLTRVHFHTLKFHIVATKHGSKWGDQLQAACSGARQAARQACDGNLTDESAFVAEIDESGVIRSWVEDDISYHYSASIVCRKPSKTVGLGDSISSSALLYSTYVI